MFLPERASLSPGTLREMVQPANKKAAVDDDKILEVLRKLKIETLVDLAGGLGSEHENWDTFFSLGEQKLIILARIFLSEPTFCFLDHIQSGLTPEQSNHVLRMFCESKITYINLGEPGDRCDCYDSLLELAGDGTWKWTDPWNGGSGTCPIRT